MSGNDTIRRVLTAMLALTILVWAEAGLALVAGDRMIGCHTMMMHGPASMTAASDDADTEAQDSDSAAMPCCPIDATQASAMAENHPACCSVSNDAERPLAFLVSSERTTTNSLDTATHVIGGLVPQPAHYFGELRNSDAPRFVKPILELKTDLRI